MTIHLSSDREQFVRSLVKIGQFASEDEVIDEALRLFQERDEQAKLAELKSAITIGIEQAEKGELATFDPLGTLARVRSRRVASTEEP